MQITIEKPSPAEYKNTFVIRADFRWNEAGGHMRHQSVEWEVDSTEHLAPTVKFLAAVDAAADEGADEDPVPFDVMKTLECAWVIDDERDIPEGHTIASRITWPMHKSVPGYLESWIVYWYDENGRSWRTIIH